MLKKRQNDTEIFAAKVKPCVSEPGNSKDLVSPSTITRFSDDSLRLTNGSGDRLGS
jgi:hypothetical protein